MLEACWFVREYIPMVAGGWDGDRTSLLKNYRAPNTMATHALDGMRAADIVVFHRANDDRAYNVALELKKLGKKIVYDNDDTYKHFTGLEQHLLKRLEYVDEWTDKFIKIADLVTCSTEFLAEEYRKLNKNVVVLPNCVDPSDWPEPQKNTNGKVRIGIVGSVATNQDFEPIKDLLPKLCARDDVEVVLFGLPAKVNPKVTRLYKNEYAFWDNLKVEWQPFVSIKDYIETLDNLKLDLMLIPRSDDYFNSCKSNLKFLEASMLNIAVIAQAFPSGKSPYQDPDDAKHMVLVSDNLKWEEEIEKLIQNPAQRVEQGEKAKEYVLSRYDINENIWRWEQAYGELLK
jgi:glycosyltransferase involved in cell wall biosynthesis